MQIAYNLMFSYAIQWVGNLYFLKDFISLKTSLKIHLPIDKLLESCWSVDEQAVAIVPGPCHIPPPQPAAGSTSSPQGAAGISEDPESEMK